VASDREGLIRIVRVRRQAPRAGRKLQQRLDVRRVKPEAPIERAEQRVVPRGVLEHHVDRSDLAPARIGSHAPAESMGQELVPVADPQDRQLRADRFPKPDRAALAPGSALRHHRGRSGDDRTRDLARRRQRVARVDLRDEHAVLRNADPRGDPVLEIPGTGTSLRQLGAGLDDQERTHCAGSSRGQNWK
jgi:hypothetical protein